MTIEAIKAELRSIIELSDKATPGEWLAVQLTIYADSGEVACAATAGRTVEEDRHNACLIAQSRSLSPKMAKALLTAIMLFEWGDDAKSLESIRSEWEGRP